MRATLIGLAILAVPGLVYLAGGTAAVFALAVGVGALASAWTIGTALLDWREERRRS